MISPSHQFSYPVDSKFVDFFVLSVKHLRSAFLETLLPLDSIKRFRFSAVQSNKDEKAKLLCWVFPAGLFVFDGNGQRKISTKSGVIA